MTQKEVSKLSTPPRKLEDLDLIDNFLFQTMMMEESVGEEFCRILLRTILGKDIRNVKIIPQKSITGLDIDRHGIRLDAYIEDITPEECMPGVHMSDAEISSDGSAEESISDAQITSDIYDIEPNKTYEKSTLPKRMRYYHALIDAQLLAVSTSYGLLPNVTTIVILPYDPFGRDQLFYTFKTQCVEDSSIPYDDGSQKIFLYTKGTKNCPSQKLRDMLKYIENSTVDNVTNQDIATLDSLVQKVKHKREVGINYMKSCEIEDLIRREALAEGREEGRSEGLERGRSIALIELVCRKLQKGQIPGAYCRRARRGIRLHRSNLPRRRENHT